MLKIVNDRFVVGVGSGATMEEIREAFEATNFLPLTTVNRLRDDYPNPPSAYSMGAVVSGRASYRDPAQSNLPKKGPKHGA